MWHASLQVLDDSPRPGRFQGFRTPCSGHTGLLLAIPLHVKRPHVLFPTCLDKNCHNNRRKNSKAFRGRRPTLTELSREPGVCEEAAERHTHL